MASSVRAPVEVLLGVVWLTLVVVTGLCPASHSRACSNETLGSGSETWPVGRVRLAWLQILLAVKEARG